MSRPFSVAVSFNLISMASSGLTLLISTIILGLLVKPLIHKNDVNILLLYTNIFIGLFGLSLCLFLDTIDTLKGDYELFAEEQTLICRIRGYMVYVFISNIRNTLALQSLFRFCCIIYPSKIWLQKYLTYIISLLIIWIISFLLILPVLILNDIQLIPEDNVCLVTPSSIRGLIWITISIYVLPTIVINNIYLRTARYLRRTSFVSTHVKRNVLVIRRIFLILIILFIIGLPIIILTLILPFTKIVEPFFYRIIYLSSGISIITLSLALIYTSPQLKYIIRHSVKKNQVAHIDIQNVNKQTPVLTIA